MGIITSMNLKGRADVCTSNNSCLFKWPNVLDAYSKLHLCPSISVRTDSNTLGSHLRIYSHF